MFKDVNHVTLSAIIEIFKSTDSQGVMITWENPHLMRKSTRKIAFKLIHAEKNNFMLRAHRTKTSLKLKDLVKILLSF